MNIYRQSIILFGIVIPILFGIAVVAIGYTVKSKMFDSYQTKIQDYQTHQTAERESRKVESQIIKDRMHLDRWTKQLSLETASAVGTNLRAIYDKQPKNEITQTSFERAQSESGFGMASAQKSTSVRIAFRGTYRTMQKAFLELETRMPQLQLEEFKMEPLATSPSLMNFQVTYTAWEN